MRQKTNSRLSELLFVLAVFVFVGGILFSFWDKNHQDRVAGPIVERLGTAWLDPVLAGEMVVKGDFRFSALPYRNADLTTTEYLLLVQDGEDWVVSFGLLKATDRQGSLRKVVFDLLPICHNDPDNLQAKLGLPPDIRRP